MSVAPRIGRGQKLVHRHGYKSRWIAAPVTPDPFGSAYRFRDMLNMILPGAYSNFSWPTPKRRQRPGTFMER